MHKLNQFRLCPHSRSIRLVLSELAIEAEFVEERPWEWRPEFLAMNPAGELPVLQMGGETLLCGTYAISEYIAEEVSKHPAHSGPVPLFPGNREARAETRRLVDWFHGKMNRDVTHEMMVQKVHNRHLSDGAKAPNTDVMRALRANLNYHLSYVAFLSGQRRWLAGEELSFADFAAAGHFSVLDYLGEVAWESHPDAKIWYQRLKSRKSFRPLLADRFPGVTPPASYTDLDF